MAAEDAKARVEVYLTNALNSLTAAEEGKHRSWTKITCLETEFTLVEAKQMSFLLELEASEGEVSSLQA